MAYGWYGELSVDKPLHQKQSCNIALWWNANQQGQCARSIQYGNIVSYEFIFLLSLPVEGILTDCATWLLSQDRFDKAIIDEGTNFSHPRYIFRLLKATARHLAQHSQIDIFGRTRVLGLLQSKAKSNWSNWKQNKGGFRSYFLGHFFFCLPYLFD